MKTAQLFAEGTARMARPRTVEFCAGNDAPQMLGAWMCWNRWCWEEQGRELDHAAWMRNQEGRANRLQVVGWDGPEPVAMVEVVVVYDAMLRERIAHCDKAWVHKDYRRRGVMEAMVAFLFPLENLLDVGLWVAPVSTGDEATAPWLKSMYERFGFKQVGLSMLLKPERVQR